MWDQRVLVAVDNQKRRGGGRDVRNRVRPPRLVVVLLDRSADQKRLRRIRRVVLHHGPGRHAALHLQQVGRAEPVAHRLHAAGNTKILALVEVLRVSAGAQKRHQVPAGEAPQTPKCPASSPYSPQCAPAATAPPPCHADLPGISPRCSADNLRSPRRTRVRQALAGQSALSPPSHAPPCIQITSDSGPCGFSGRYKSKGNFLSPTRRIRDLRNALTPGNSFEDDDSGAGCLPAFPGRSVRRHKWPARIAARPVPKSCKHFSWMSYIVFLRIKYRV